MKLLDRVLQQVEAGRVPDTMIRMGIRRLLRQRLDSLERDQPDIIAREEQEFSAMCSGGAIAEHPELANKQHYEVPSGFFEAVLGPRLKYSCCYFSCEETTLADAEESALLITAHHAGLQDGQQVLELGCGWGSLSLWMAEHYPNSRITAVSNSASQRNHIEARARERGLKNLSVRTADMNEFTTKDVFDRVVSVEMFEHMRNHEELLRRISQWLKPDGRLFVHIFCHRSRSWLFEDRGPDDWMARQFFSGGMMPALTLLPRYQSNLQIVKQWQWSGRHYEQTCNAWLSRLDSAGEEALSELTRVYGPEMAPVQLQRWRIFFMSCAELFGFRDGTEWMVTHLLFEPRTADAAPQGDVTQ